jgi:hypothetical protein
VEHKQDKARFEPTVEQVAFAEAYIENKGNISRACEAIGDPDRNKYYGRPNGWHYQEGFELWLSERAKTDVLKRVGKWYLIAEKYAETGSFQHLNMLMQVAKEFSPTALIDQSKHEHITYVWGKGKNDRDNDTLRASRIPTNDTQLA